MIHALKRWLKSARAHKGVLAMLATALFIALIVLVVLLMDGLEERYGLRADMSFNSLTTQSAITREALASLDKDVEIIAVYPDGDEDSTMLALLGRYAAATPRITYTVENLARNPSLASVISDSAGENAVTADCLILSCERTGRTRVLTPQDYYTLSYDTELESFVLSGITYEKAITEAILYITRESIPRIQILTGHGELGKEDTLLMEQLLTSANYELARVDLRDGDMLSPGALLMILSPQKDLLSEELAALTAFCAAGGSLFITSDFTTPVDLPNFNALYRAFGFFPLSGLVVADKANTSEYFSDYPAQLMPDMLSTPPTSRLVALGQDQLLLAGARAFATPSSTNTLSTNVVLRSGETSYLRNIQDGILSLDKQEGDSTGAYALAIVSDWLQEEDLYARAFIIGSSSLFYDEYLITQTYSMEFMLEMIQYLQGEDPIDLGIIPKVAARPGLTMASVAPATVVTVMLPLLVMLLAMVVLMPRRHL